MNKHFAIVQGEARYVRHRHRTQVIGWSIHHSIEKGHALDEYRTIWEGELSTPLLDKGDTIFIPKIEQRVKITNRIIDIESGIVTYETGYAIETIENEASRESLLLAEKILERHKQEEREWKERKLQIEKEAKESFETEHGLNEYFRNGCEPKESKRSWFEKWFG